jgi:hypothetical protein
LLLGVSRLLIFSAIILGDPKLSDCSMPAALGRGHVAPNSVHGVGGVGARVLDCARYDPGFGLASALEPPPGLGDFFDQHFLDFVGRGVLFAEGGAESVEFGGIFAAL